MPALRLNNWNHRQIAENVVNRSPLKKAADELDAIRCACADRIYEQSLTKAQHEAVNTMPVEWFAVTDRYHVRYSKPGNKEPLSVELRLSQPRRSPSSRYTNGYVPISYGLAVEEWEVAREKCKVADEGVYQLREKVMAAVSAHRTLESLLKAWPEIKTEIPDELKPVEKAVSTALMAIPGLNEALGLPKPEVKQGVTIAPARTRPSKLKKAA